MNQYTNKEYTVSEVNVIVDLYTSGLSISKISNQEHRSKKSIKKILIEHNVFIEGRDNIKKKLDENKVIELYNNGLSLKKIGEQFNVSREPIKRVIKEAGILRGGYSNGKKIELNKQQKEKIKDMYLHQYQSMVQISDELGLNKHFIEKYLGKSNYRRTKSEGVSIGLYKRYRGVEIKKYLTSLDRYKKYETEVYKITRQQPISELKNYKERGNSGVDGAYHLDHRFSIVEAFKENIDPKIIGNIINLEFLPWEDNIKKRTKCSITKDELIIKYKNNG